MSPVTVAAPSHAHYHHHHPHHPTMHPNTAHYHTPYHHYIPPQVSHSQHAKPANIQQSSQSSLNYNPHVSYSYGQNSNCIRTNSVHSQPLFVYNQSNAYGKHCPNKRCHNTTNNSNSTTTVATTNTNNSSSSNNNNNNNNNNNHSSLVNGKPNTNSCNVTHNGIHHPSKPYNYFGAQSSQQHPKPGTNPPLLMEPHVGGTNKIKPNSASNPSTGVGLSLPLKSHHTTNNSFELTTTPVGGTLSLIASGFANATHPQASHSHPVGKSHPTVPSGHFHHPMLGSQQLSFTANGDVLSAGSTIQLHRFGLSSTAAAAAVAIAPSNTGGSPSPGTCPLAGLSGANHALYHPSPSAVTEALNHVPPSVLSSEDTYICCSYLPRCFIIQKIKPGSSLACSLESERSLSNHPTYMLWNANTKEILHGLKFHNKLIPDETEPIVQIPNGSQHEAENNKTNQKNDTPPPELIPAPEILASTDNQNKNTVDKNHNNNDNNQNTNNIDNKDNKDDKDNQDTNNKDNNHIQQQSQTHHHESELTPATSAATSGDSTQQSWIDLLDQENDESTKQTLHEEPEHDHHSNNDHNHVASVDDNNNDNNNNNNNNNNNKNNNNNSINNHDDNDIDCNKESEESSLDSVVLKTEPEPKFKKDDCFRKSNEPLDEMFMPMFVRNKSPTCGSLKNTKKSKDNECESIANSLILSGSVSTSSLSHPSTPDHSDDDDNNHKKQPHNHHSSSNNNNNNRNLISNLDYPSEQSKLSIDSSELNNTGSSSRELFRGETSPKTIVERTVTIRSSSVSQANAPSASSETDKSIPTTDKSDIPSVYHECQVRPAVTLNDSSFIVGKLLESHVSLLVTPEITVQQQCSTDSDTSTSAAFSVTANESVGAETTAPPPAQPPKTTTTAVASDNSADCTTSTDNEEEDCLSLVVVTPSSCCALDSGHSLTKTDSKEQVSTRVNSATDKHSSSTYPESASIRKPNITIITQNEVNNEIIFLKDSSTNRSNSRTLQELDSIIETKENHSVKSSPITVANKDSVTMAAIEVTNQESSAKENGVVESMNALNIQVNGTDPNAAVNNDNSTKHPQVLRNVRGLPEEELRADLRRQLEYYFSVCNLAKDRYLISQMDDEQYVPISIVAGFNEIRRLTHDYDLVVEVLRSTPEVIVDDAGQKVKPNHKRCVVILRDVPDQIGEEAIKKMFDINSCPVKLVKCEFASNSSWYLFFADDEDAKKAITFMKEKLIHYPDTKIPIMARIKAKPIVQQFRTMEYVPTSTAALPGGVVAGTPATLIRPIAPSPVGSVISNSSATISPVSQYSATGSNAPAAVHVQDYIQDGSSVAAVASQNGAPAFGIAQIYSHYPTNSANRIYQMYSPQMLSVSPSQNGCYDLTSVFVANSLTPHTAYPGLVSSISTPSSAPIVAVAPGGGGAATSTGASSTTTLGQPYPYIPMVSVAGNAVPVVGSVPAPVVTSAPTRFNGQPVHHNVGGVHPVAYVSNSNYNTYPKNYRNNNSNNAHGSQNGKRSSKYNPNWHSSNSHHNQQSLPQQQQQQQQQHSNSGGGNSFHYNAQYLPNTSVQVEASPAPTATAQNSSQVSTQDPKPPKSRSVNSAPQASKNGQKQDLLKNDNGSRNNGGRVGRSYTTAGNEARPNRSSSNTYRTNNARYSSNGFPPEGDNRGLHFNERSSSLKYSKSPANFHGKDSTSGSGGSAHNYSHHQSHHHSASERNSRSNSSASTIQTDFVLAATAFPPLPGSAVGNPANEASNKLSLQNGCDSNDKKSSRPASSASQHSQVGECSIKTNDCDNSNSSKEKLSKETSAPATATAATTAAAALASGSPVNHKSSSVDKDLLLNGNTPDLSGGDDIFNSLKENGDTPQQNEVQNSSSMTYAQKLKAAKLAKQQQSATLNGDHSTESSVSQNA